ncbi:phage tail protein [Duganella sp. Root1480D1]|uniref:phage tail protein n=1 Tax=Duganella sp. Root1480D1 TaxID=1736471 RepID=UPI00070ADFB2|nr:tail fiber protein [Duganella sp. Root1480D1]KQZ26974.1 phage tail protein [Duganella sp. Root1480D1]
MDNFIGEIRLFAGNFPPLGWAFCDGSLLSIAQNTALFALIGTTYGGNGQTTFALPDLRGRVPLHQGTQPGTANNYVMGQQAGAETVTLTSNQIPLHSHSASASTAVPPATGSGITLTGPAVYVPAAPAKPKFYAPAGSATVAMSAQAIQPAGGNQPHDNMAPFLAVSFIIAIEGIFPSQN